MAAQPVIAIPNWVSYELHGGWVEHREHGWIGRIGYHDTWCERVAVVWEDGPPVDLQRPLIPMSEVRLLDREPRPWYDFEAIDRRRPVHD